MRYCSLSDLTEAESILSLEIALVLFVTSLFSLFFALRTHSHLYIGESAHSGHEALGVTEWSKAKSISVLLAATAGVALMSEFLVGAVEHTAHTFGMTDVFVGVILVAILCSAFHVMLCREGLAQTPWLYVTKRRWPTSITWIPLPKI